MSKMDIYVTNDNKVVRIDNGDGTHTAVYYDSLKDGVGRTNERLTNEGHRGWNNRGEPVWTAPKPKRYTVEKGTVIHVIRDSGGHIVGSSLFRDNAQKIADALNAQEGL